MIGVGTIGCRMDHTLRNSDRTCAAFCAQLIKCRRLWTDAAIVGNVGASHRCREHPVAEGGSTQGNRLARMWVLLNHNIPPCFLWSHDHP